MNVKRADAHQYHGEVSCNSSVVEDEAQESRLMPSHIQILTATHPVQELSDRGSIESRTEPASQSLIA
jgi:hypothetical protein